MQKDNIFNNKNLFLSKSKTTLSIDEALNSIDMEDDNFINFMSSKVCKEFLYIKKCYDRIKNGNYSFLEKEFKNREYETFDANKNSRLRNFIFYTNNQLFSDSELQKIIKYKNKENKAIQFFVKYDRKSDNATICLIDLYHLVMPTEYRQIGAKISTNTHYLRIKKKVSKKTNLKEITY